MGNVTHEPAAAHARIGEPVRAEEPVRFGERRSEARGGTELLLPGPAADPGSGDRLHQPPHAVPGGKHPGALHQREPAGRGVLLGWPGHSAGDAFLCAGLDGAAGGEGRGAVRPAGVRDRRRRQGAAPAAAPAGQFSAVAGAGGPALWRQRLDHGGVGLVHAAAGAGGGIPVVPAAVFALPQRGGDHVAPAGAAGGFLPIAEALAAD